MTTLAILVYSAVQQFVELTDAFVRSGFSVARGVRYFRAKQRLKLYQLYCREVWCNQLARAECNERRVPRQQPIDCVDFLYNPLSGGDSLHSSNGDIQKRPELAANRVRNQNESASASASAKGSRTMNRAVLDFAAVEASMEAMSVFDVHRVDAAAETGANGCTDEGLDIFDNLNDIEVVSGTEVDATFYEYIDALPVYYDDKIGSLTEGVSFTINGYILVNCERFSINFMLDGGRDIALHINPRLPQNYVVRNTKVKNIWGREEVSSALPFSLQRGSKFAMQVLVTEGCYMISVNGHHFAEYSHRLPYTAVTALDVKGDVDNVTVERSLVNEYPTRLPESKPKVIRLARSITADGSKDGSGDASYDETDVISIPEEWRIIRKQNIVMPSPSISEAEGNGLALPYYGLLPAQALVEGRCLRIEGRVKILPHSFYINLQQGQNIWPHPVIAFHFNPRFSKQSGAIGKAIVCRNAWHSGKWSEEERSELLTDFLPGKTFSLAIVCTGDSFEVYVNKKFVLEFRYQVQPDIVDTVYIQGDIKLWDVMLDKNSITSGQTRIYQNPGYTDDF